MAETTQAPSNGEKLFFYYPGTSKKKARRIVLAGIVRGNKILVAESILFPGKNPTLVDEEVIDTPGGPATAILLLHDAIPPDSFNKKYGRAKALDHCRGYYYNIDATKEGVNYIQGTYTDKNGVHKLTPIPCDTRVVFSIDLAENEPHPGRLFVSEVTKRYPAKPRKVVVEPSFTLTEIKNFIAKEFKLDTTEVTAANISIANRGGEPAPVQE